MAPARVEPDMSTYSGRVSNKLRLARDAANLSVKQLAKKMKALGFEVASTTLTAWENGQTKPNLDAIPYFAKAVKLKQSDITEIFPPMKI